MSECVCHSGFWLELDNGAKIGFEAGHDGMHMAVESPASGVEVWAGPIAFCPLCGREFG